MLRLRRLSKHLKLYPAPDRSCTRRVRPTSRRPLISKPGSRATKRSPYQCGPSKFLSNVSSQALCGIWTASRRIVPGFQLQSQLHTGRMPVVMY